MRSKSSATFPSTAVPMLNGSAERYPVNIRSSSRSSSTSRIDDRAML
jgi:hypothetical protein